MQPSHQPAPVPSARLARSARLVDPEHLSVGAVAARLGVAPATVRSWGRRYGLLPSDRSAGGHRRYTEGDVADLVRMQTLVAGGVTPAAAAAAVSAERSGGTVDGGAAARIDAGATLPGGRRRSKGATSGGPGGRVLAVPGASVRAQGLARAASRLDAEAIGKILGDLLEVEGTIATWEEVLLPVLAAAGAKWARTGDGIDIEHVLSEATIDAFRAHRARQAPAIAGPPIVLACSAGDLHVLPLHVLGSALAERRVPTLLLGARVPGPALVSAVRRTRAAGVFVWRQQAVEVVMDVDVAELLRARPAPLLVVGGPGWDVERLSPGVHLSLDLTETVTALASAAITGGVAGH